MFDMVLLNGVLQKNEKALEKIIDKYAAYVCVVISNTTGGKLSKEDIEEVAADTFFALWEHAGQVEKLKPWLGATARNKGKNKLRDSKENLPLEETYIREGLDEMDQMLLSKEKQQAVKDAIFKMDSPDKEIFLRYYYQAQTASVIASQIGLTESAVKQRLVRGRKKLATTLGEEVCLL